ncbi:TetR/AcrR family transcriptional regulator [Leucobacter tenebrionis]|uniref:TetR/AcrR family transcriptional regulator n=1 Tax=Leucobacter tenebrionis TaxID=2873270 RepID=UPI001CA5FE3A|nr:helix-turn-helix domain-containing protein [Leucobacter tenebrionis]QZY52005.1 TetR/AcrR family transcriptional regulator [Leucobacter tenebrionis]
MSTAQRRARRRPGENRERLLEAGLIEFGLFGYHAASTSSIAARAGVPQPHVYANFETKQALFLACFDRLRVSLVAEDAESVSESALRFVYQAVGAASAPEMGDVLRPALRELREELGESSFDRLLADGARVLLSDPSSGSAAGASGSAAPGSF